MAQGDVSPNRKHEERDVEVGVLAKIAVFGVVVIALVLVAMYGLFRFVRNQETSLDGVVSPYAAVPTPFIGPKLQVSPPQDLREILANERAVLDSYGWIDRDQGVVRIPIDRAMDLLSERGLPNADDGATEQQP
jgi:hypothetical protein